MLFYAPNARANQRARRSRRRTMWMAGLVGIVLLGGTIATLRREVLRRWLFTQMTELGYRETSDARARSQVLPALANWLRRERVRLPTIAIDIKFSNMERLRARRTQALAASVLVQDSLSFVPGLIRADGRAIRIKLRLKGDWTDHLEGGRWAFRVHVRDDEHLMGMRRFSLHHPGVRDHQRESVYLTALRYYGVLAPRYDFVEVILNGERLGVMAIEEHFAKELLENQGRRDGVILKLDESRLWLPWARAGRVTDNPFADRLKTEIVPFQRARIERSPDLTRQWELAAGLYRGMLYHGIEPRDVFDVQTTARFLAVTHAFGAWHATRWHNRRFYFNPVTARLEPIGFDAMAGDPQLGMALAEPFDRRLLADSVIRDAYIATLERLIADLEAGRLEWYLAEAERTALRKLRGQFPFLGGGWLDGIRERVATALRHVREESRVTAPDLGSFPPYDTSGYTGDELLGLYTVRRNGVSGVEVRNLSPTAVEILSTDFVEPSGGTEAGPTAACPDSLPIPRRLAGTPYGILPTRHVVWLERDLGACAVRVTARKAGHRRMVEVTSARYAMPLERPPLLPMPIVDLTRRYAFLQYDASRREIRVRPGEWRIANTIVIPSGVALAASPGTRLRFGADATLVINGETDFRGTAADPITLTGDGDGRTWPGLVVFNDRTTASWQHVAIENTTGVRVDGWSLTGGAVIHGGAVVMSDVSFIGHRGEDALNLVSTEFEIRRIAVQQAVSDGLDVDFGHGTIAGGSFDGIGRVGGGDAIDISGAVVTISDVEFRHVGDKALSVGERGTVYASTLAVTDAGAAVVSKDRSWIGLSDATIREVWNTALMAYTKKKEFGGAVLDASDVLFQNVARTAQAQLGSMLTVNGSRVGTVPLNVDSLYATVMRSGFRP